jgi:hypothetical protein
MAEVEEKPAPPPSDAVPARPPVRDADENLNPDFIAAVAEAVGPLQRGVVHVEGDGTFRGQGPQLRLLLVDAGQPGFDPGDFGGQAVDLGFGLAVPGGGLLDVPLELGPAGRVRVCTFSGQGRGSRGVEAGEQNQPGSKES